MPSHSCDVPRLILIAGPLLAFPDFGRNDESATHSSRPGGEPCAPRPASIDTTAESICALEPCTSALWSTRRAKFSCTATSAASPSSSSAPLSATVPTWSSGSNGIFCWCWLADLCTQEAIPFVLGHALYMKAIHGGKAKNDKIDAHKIAVLLRGGAFPLAYVYPRQLRATRDLLRRRLLFVPCRGELFTHIRITFHQLHPRFASCAARSPRGFSPRRETKKRPGPVSPGRSWRRRESNRCGREWTNPAISLRPQRIWGVWGARVWAGVWDSPAAAACPARADRLMASPGAPGHRRPWRLRPSDSSGPHPHLPGRPVRPPHPRIDRDDRSPRRSTRSSSIISRPSSPGRPKPIPSVTVFHGGSRRTSEPICGAASSPTGSPGPAARTAATSD